MDIIRDLNKLGIRLPNDLFGSVISRHHGYIMGLVGAETAFGVANFNPSPRWA